MSNHASENAAPIYDQTVEAQGFDPIRDGIAPATVQLDDIIAAPQPALKPRKPPLAPRNG